MIEQIIIKLGVNNANKIWFGEWGQRKWNFGNIGSFCPISVWSGRPLPCRGVILPRTPKVALFLVEFSQDSEQCLKSSINVRWPFDSFFVKGFAFFCIFYQSQDRSEMEALKLFSVMLHFKKYVVAWNYLLKMWSLVVKSAH